MNLRDLAAVALAVDNKEPQSALPHAPVVPERVRARRRAKPPTMTLAFALRRTAVWLEARQSP